MRTSDEKGAQGARGTAGWCSACGDNVWLRPDGRCPRGHRSYLIWARYDAAPIDPAAPVPGTPLRRVDWVRVGVAAALLLALLAVTIPAMFRGLSPDVRTANSGAGTSTPRSTPSEAEFDPYGTMYEPATPRESAHIRELAEKDFPGWEMGEVVTDWGSTDAMEKRFVIWLVPPGRDFTIGIAYNREADKDIIRDDEVLAAAAPGHYIADELLEVIEQAYIRQGATQIVPTSYYGGIASVEWTRPVKDGLVADTAVGMDQLDYDFIKQEWSIGRDAEWQ